MIVLLMMLIPPLTVIALAVRVHKSMGMRPLYLGTTGARSALDDSGLDWEWTRTEFRKALIACATAANDVGFDEGPGLFQELHACSLLLLHNFRERLSLKQQSDLSALAEACEFDSCELRDDPKWDDQYTRDFIEGAITYARKSTPLFEGI